MKIKKSVFCGFCLLEILGISILFWAWKIGCAVIISGILFLVWYIRKTNVHKSEVKNCIKCKSEIPLKARICPECGYSYSEAIKEEELLDVLEREENEELTSEKIDCDFEKIEEVVIDEISNYDGDIEEFLKERDRKTEILSADFVSKK